MKKDRKSVARIVNIYYLHEINNDLYKEVSFTSPSNGIRLAGTKIFVLIWFSDCYVIRYCGQLLFFLNLPLLVLFNQILGQWKAKGKTGGLGGLNKLCGEKLTDDMVYEAVDNGKVIRIVGVVKK